MPKYISIKDEVIHKLELALPEIRERFGIEKIGIFGSVSRGEDTQDSDVDIFYSFYPDRVSYDAFFSLHEFLENLFQRRVELVSEICMSPQLRVFVEPDMIVISHPADAA